MATKEEQEAIGLVVRIIAFNDAWHALRDLWPDSDPDEPMLAGLREMKACLQARLIRDGGGGAYLVRDLDSSLPEPCFSVGLRRPIGGRHDACHIPERVARRVLTAREIEAALVER